MQEICIFLYLIDLQPKTDYKSVFKIKTNLNLSLS